MSSSKFLLKAAFVGFLALVSGSALVGEMVRPVRLGR